MYLAQSLSFYYRIHGLINSESSEVHYCFRFFIQPLGLVPLITAHTNFFPTTCNRWDTEQVASISPGPRSASLSYRKGQDGWTSQDSLTGRNRIYWMRALTLSASLAPQLPPCNGDARRRKRGWSSPAKPSWRQPRTSAVPLHRSRASQLVN